MNTQKKEIVKYLTDLGYVELATIRQPHSITTATKYARFIKCDKQTESTNTKS